QPDRIALVKTPESVTVTAMQSFLAVPKVQSHSSPEATAAALACSAASFSFGASPTYALSVCLEPHAPRVDVPLGAGRCDAHECPRDRRCGSACEADSDAVDGHVGSFSVLGRLTCSEAIGIACKASIGCFPILRGCDPCD